MKLTQNQLRKLICHTSIAFIFVCTIQVTSASEETQYPLRYNLGGTGSFVPYGYFGDSAKPGVFAEVLKLILQRTDHPYKFYFFPPKRASKAFKENRLDLDFMSPSWFENGDIGEEYVSTATIFSLTEYIVTLSKNSLRYSNQEDIYGKRVGTVAGYNYHNENKFIRVDFLSENALVRGLVKGRFELIILEGLTAHYWSRIHQVPISLASIHSQGDIVIRLRKELSYLLPGLNDAIQSLKSEGEIEKVLKSYNVM